MAQSSIPLASSLHTAFGAGQFACCAFAAARTKKAGGIEHVRHGGNIIEIRQRSQQFNRSFSVLGSREG